MNRKVLKHLMKERGIGIWRLSEEVKMGKLELLAKMLGIFEFTAKEILLIEKALFLNSDQIMDIFFEQKFPKGNKKERFDWMGIWHPDILRAEKFGSRSLFKVRKRCCFCNRFLKEDEFISDVIGNLFCDESCREGRIKRLKTGRTL